MMLSTKTELERSALRIRLGIIRAISANRGGHIGGSMDLAELMAVLYSDFMRVRPDQPDWEDRDFFIMSKGHAGPVLYSTLALKGFFPYDRLDNLNNFNSLLPGHCDRTKVPGVDATTGSLGQGLSLACGAALAAKVKHTDQRVFCVLGDGESAEGQVWEAAQFAAHYRLDNLVAFLDFNKKQIDGTNDAVLSLGDPVKKYEAFGWNTARISGHDVLAIQGAVADMIGRKNGKPSMIVLDTIKGKGAVCVEQIENNHCIGFPAELQARVKEELRTQCRELGVEEI